MRVAWENRYWPLDDELIPSRSYLEKRADELEQDDFRAEPLTSVVTKDQDDPDLLVPVWSSTGSLQMKKGAQQIEEPKNSEALRRRIKILGLGLMFLGLRHSNRSYLPGMTPQLFEDYLSYLLSDLRALLLPAGKDSRGICHLRTFLGSAFDLRNPSS